MLATAKLWIALGVVAVIAVLAVFAGWEYDQRKLDADKLDKVTAALAAQGAVMASIQAGVQASNQAITDMTAAQAQVTQHGGVVRARVVALHGSDDAIRKWLDAPLPAGGCMLDDTCPSGGVSGPAVAGAASSVHAP